MCQVQESERLDKRFVEDGMRQGQSVGRERPMWVPFRIATVVVVVVGVVLPMLVPASVWVAASWASRWRMTFVSA